MKGFTLRRTLEIGGFAAAAVLIAFGIAAIVMGVNGRSTVHSNLAQEKIVFGNAADDPAIPAKYSGALVDDGDKARAFAVMIRTHALDSTNGLTYAEMGRYMAKPDAPAAMTDGNGGTSDAKYALTDADGRPVANGARNLWVTATALTSALNLAYTAEQISLFGVVVGIALLLSGVGFGVLAFSGALREARLPRRQRGRASELAPTA